MLQENKGGRGPSLDVGRGPGRDLEADTCRLRGVKQVKEASEKGSPWGHSGLWGRDRGPEEAGVPGNLLSTKS